MHSQDELNDLWRRRVSTPENVAVFVDLPKRQIIIVNTDTPPTSYVREQADLMSPWSIWLICLRHSDCRSS